MGNQGLKPMTESSLLAAVSIIMALVSTYLPVIGPFLAMVWPLPIVLLIVRHGMRQGITAAVATGLMVALLVHPLQALALVVAFGTVGLALGYAYRRGFGAVRILLIGTGASIVGKVIVIGLSMLILEMNPFDMQLDAMDSAVKGSAEIYRSAGMSEEEIAKNAENFEQSIATVRLLIPIVIVLAGLVDAFVNFTMTGRVLRRLGHLNVPELPQFAAWRLPPAIAYAYAFSLIGMYWGHSREIATLYQTSLNVNMLANLLGLVQGLAVMNCAIRRYRLPLIARNIIWIIVLINMTFLQIVSLIGIVDTIFDYRRKLGLER